VKKQSVRKKDVILGLSVGLAIGVLALAGILLLARPWQLTTPAAQPPSLTITPAPSVVATGVPSATPKPLPSPTATIEPPEVVSYTVKEDDTLYDIATFYGITVEAIKAANGLISDDIYPGDVLTIPLSAGTLLPTPTVFSDGEAFVYIVASGDTLSEIAERYGVTVGAIQSANGLTSDAIQAGQELVIPLGGTTVEIPTAEPGTQTWQPSILEGDLEAAYPLAEEAEQFTLHYQPDSWAARELDTVMTMVEIALAHIESTLDVALEGHFDVYVAGSLFAPPDLALRGRSFSSQRRLFFLYDGTGTPADRQYILTHELTHLTTWNTMGRPASVMLHEGVAVYVGMELAERQDANYVSIEEFCAAYHQIGRLPRMSGSPSFQGHIRDLDTYYAAGCFVQYLVEEYGTDKFAEVYHTGDYYSVYGKGLTGLEAEWIAAIASSDYSLPFDPDELAYYVAEVAAAYDRLFANFRGTSTQMAAYHELDRTRMALLQGYLDDAATYLAAFDELLAEE